MTKRIHIFLLAVICVTYISAVFTDALWFDEAFTLCLQQQDWPGFLRAVRQDVHPIGYPLLARGVLLFAGCSPVNDPSGAVMLLRLLSVIPVILTAILGLTHISPLYGRRCGLLFTLLFAFSPATFYYGTQIRMYSWAALLVFLTFLNVCRIPERNSCDSPGAADKRPWAGMCLWGTLAAYTHHYALLAVGCIELYLLCRIREDRADRRRWLLCAAVQAAAYTPGLLLTLKQIQAVSSGYWITMDSAHLFFETAAFFLQGSLPLLPAAAMGLFLWALVLIHTAHLVRKKKWNAPGCAAVFVIFLVLAVSLLCSLKQPVYIPRYLFPVAGLFWLAAARTVESCVTAIARQKPTAKKTVMTIFLGTAAAFCVTVSAWGILYGRSALLSQQNSRWKDTVVRSVRPTDSFYYSDLRVGCLAAAYFPGNRQLFSNQYCWNDKNGLSGFGRLETVSHPPADSLLPGQRVWIIDSSRTLLSLKESGELTCLMSSRPCTLPYCGEDIRVSLWQKKTEYGIMKPDNRLAGLWSRRLPQQKGAAYVQNSGMR